MRNPATPQPSPTRAAKRQQLNATFAALALLSLTACGGGDVTPTPVPPPPPPPPVAVSGKVMINQAIAGATVCMDLNANSTCDVGEPTAAATKADGAFSFTYDPSLVTATQVSTAPLIAMVPTTAIDAAAPTLPVGTQAMVLSAPAGKAAQINPLTTLVQTGVAAGLTLAKAEAAVAVQLGVPAADIYDYQANAVSTTSVPDTARSMAGVVVYAMQTSGAKLSVVDIATANDPSTQLAGFSYTDSKNYGVRDFLTTEVVGTGKTTVADVRRGMTAGVATTDANLFAQVYLTEAGWVRCDGKGFPSTRGTPTRSAYCGGGLPSAGFTITTDVSGKPMADVVKAMQAATDGSNSINMDANLLGTQIFPAGSGLSYRYNTNIGQAIYINNANSVNEVGVAGGVKTLEDYIADRRAKTISLTTGSGMSYIGSSSDTSHYLMASYLDSTSQAQYYSCTFDAVTTAINGCVALTKGTFSIKTFNGVRMIVFADQPASPATQKYTIGYAEYAGGVARARQNKGDSASVLTYSQRLSGAAGEALKKAMGV